MKKECQRCGELGFFLSKKELAKLKFSATEKAFVFKEDLVLCGYCVLQLKTRLTIKKHYSALNHNNLK